MSEIQIIITFFFYISRTIDNVINSLCRSLGDNLKIETCRPYGSSTVLKITLGKIMKGIVVLKRLMVEWVVVKGATEDLLTEDEKIDMWGESRYKVFRKVTENANAAMLHFYSPAYPELAIRSFLVSKHFVSVQHLFLKLFVLLNIHDCNYVYRFVPTDMVQQLPVTVHKPMQEMWTSLTQSFATNMEGLEKFGSVP